jgi:acid stress-induced BolA-like protein IbaG/YrbA
MHMTTQAQLQQTLATMPDVDNVTVVGEDTLIATVVSGSFRGQNEAQRQETVWGHVRKQLGSGALQNIEFIFTNTPEESAA